METIETPGEISFDDFMKVDIRSGTITKSERVEKSEKLLKLEVYFGHLGHRTIMAGIAKSYDADSIVGLRVVAVLNLAPRKMMGVMSHGMLLAGQNDMNDGVTLVQCFNVSDGTRLG